MKIFSTIRGWFSYGNTAMGETTGAQSGQPSSALIDDIPAIGQDAALQISAVWAAVALIAKTIATLPLFSYETVNGARQLARGTPLWELLHESPNNRMTPCEFWIAMFMNLLLRGNAYARIERDQRGNAYALWPMPSDQVEVNVMKDGSIVYVYRIDDNVAVLAESNVLHLKEMGNGTMGLSRLDYMRVTTSEAANAQDSANRLFKNGGKPSGVLMIDKVLGKDQRKTLMERFSDMALGTGQRLHILEADMKYQQITMTPEDIQLLSTRSFTVHEIGRWFGTPSILLNVTEGTTTLGSSSGEIIEAFYKLTIRPALVSIEQAIRKRVMTLEQRRLYTVEYSLDALLRASLSARMDIYSKGTQNAIYTRNECRQLENLPPIDGGDDLTAQSNLVPIQMLGKVKPTGGAHVPENPISQ